MQFGYFDPQNREYVITNPRTPVKWINYLGARAFGGIIDHTGGMLLCKDDPTFGRITKYIQQMPAADFKGSTLYLRLHTDEGYQIYSPFFVPTLIDLDRYECHIGLGYSRFVAEYQGIQTDITIFVPPDESCAIWSIEVANRSQTERSLDAIPVVEYSHPDALQQFTNADWVPQTMQSQAVWHDDLLILQQYPFMRRDICINYLTSTLPADSFESDRTTFLGDYGYHGFQQPKALYSSSLGNTEAKRGDNIGAMLLPLPRLGPGNSVRFAVLFGQAVDLTEADAALQQYRHPSEIDDGLRSLGQFWDRYLGAQQVETPDEDMNIMLNVHNPHQCYIAKTWSRYLSTYQTGLGARGIGFRDSMQDVMAVVPAAPEEAREFLQLLLSFQKADGSAMHQFNPLTMVGSEGDSLEMEDRPHFYSDDHLWGILAVTAYLRETADWGFLSQELPFYMHPDKKGEAVSGTVRHHLDQALAFTRQNTGQHGLPLLGFADWNDTVNLPEGAESLFTANLYGLALLEMIRLANQLGESKTAQAYQADYDEMKARFQHVGWDGLWFRRYFDAGGNPLGSADNKHGQIYLNAQSWAVLSGFATDEQARLAMDAAHERLNTQYGLKLSHPGFDGYDPEIGGVTTYPPGAKENGGIFLHPNPWAVMAEARLGNAERAYRYYRQINPVTKNDIIDIYQCEPYVYAQNILGPEHPQFGLARNSWLTGTAGWCYQAATQWILGIRPDYAGLLIDPCIPANWKAFSVWRRFRGKMFHILIENPRGVNRGVSRMLVDGQEIHDPILDPDQPGDEIQVKVELGG